MSPKKTLIASHSFSQVLASELDAVRKRRQFLSNPGLKAQLETSETLAAPTSEGPILAPGQSVGASDHPAALTGGEGQALPPSPALKEITDQKAQRLDALQMHLAGLAISGGGIRSATFALGLLQGLAQLDFLERFDYISTVSGGGYIGSWLAAWTKRENDVLNVYRQLRPRRDDQSEADRPPLPKGADGVVDEEPEPVHHLRSYSSYLAPRSGLFTPDTWSLLAIYARNLLVNFLILLPATVVLVTLVRLALLAFCVPTSSYAGGPDHPVREWTLILVVSFVFMIALSVVFNVIGMELFKMQEARNLKKALKEQDKQDAQKELQTAILRVARRTFSAIVAIAVLVVVLSRGFVLELIGRPWVPPFLALLAAISLLNFIFIVTGQGKLKSRPPIGIFRLLLSVVAPLGVSAVLCCWLLSINPVGTTNGVKVVQGVILPEADRDKVFLPDAGNFVTRLHPLGYKFLISPLSAPWFLAGQAPQATDALAYAPFDKPSYRAELSGKDRHAAMTDWVAFKGWSAGKLYWWPALVPIVFFALMHGSAHLFINWNVLFRLLLDPDFVERSLPWSLSRVRMCATLAFVPFVSGAVGGLLFFILATKGLWAWHHQPQALVTFGPPLAILLFTVSAAMEIGLLGRRLEEDEREWWARVGALALLAATAWVFSFCTVLYIPWLIELAGENRNQIWVKSGLTVSWIVASVGGALAGRSPSTGNETGKPGGLKELLAQAAPWVFLVGLLAGVSLLVGSVCDAPRGEPHDHWAEVDLASLPSLAGLCLGSALFAWAMSRLIDVNLFSLHNMYANRLIRAYLGASRKKSAWANRWGTNSRPIDRCGAPTDSQGGVREENPISGFDFDDDIPLLEFRMGRKSGDLNLPAYWGPVPLINTALNLVATRELDWQERRAESFVLSPYYCGSESTGYQTQPEDFRRGNLTLGRAMAVSGAAADPNMGHHTSTPVTALMTVFNTRLGWWVENPSRPLHRRETVGTARWAAESPSFGGLILKELTGQTDSVGDWVHLSDGGHFENLAAYELIRRRCRYVVISDAGCDPELAFEDLANLIRKCRTDFGIRIEIDTAPIQKRPGGGPSLWHCAVGKIRYDDVDDSEVPGLLIYVKSSMTGDEPPDLQQYARSDPTFPHQTTADQFFDETQFESYRALGYHVALDVFGEVRGAALDDPERTNPTAFSKLRNRWFPALPELEANFEKVAEAFERLQQTLRSDHNLRGFTYDLYPELGPAPPEADLKVDPVDRACAELHAANQVVLLMEKAWIAVKLEGFPEHPMNRGWLNQFRRCASSATVRRLWPLLRGAFSQEFVRFCEQELLLPGTLPEPVEFSPSGTHDLAYKSLKDEFAREWPSRLPFLERAVGAARSPSPGGHRAWLVLDGNPEPFAYGIALKSPAEQSVSEVMVWVRPAYRNLRIGQKCFRSLFPGDPKETLRVEYPKAPPGGDKLRLDLWKFFHFTQHFRLASDGEKSLVLERRPSDAG